MSDNDQIRKVPIGKTSLQDVIEEETEKWMINRKVESGASRGRLWMELAQVLGVTDRQVKRYYLGDTPLPSDKILPLCNHINSIKPIRYLVMAIEPKCDAELDAKEIIWGLMQSIEEYREYVVRASKALSKGPDYKSFREFKERSRVIRDQILRFEWIFRQVIDEARDRRKMELRKARRLELELEDEE